MLNVSIPSTVGIVAVRVDFVTTRADKVKDVRDIGLKAVAVSSID
jgi:hypothetical protein